MDVDSFLAASRWEILQIIANKPSSPIEIAQKLKTTVSYVSQQLKLLEIAGFIKKEKTGQVEKGKPRNVYSLSKEIAYVVSLSKEFSVKKIITLDEINKIILKTIFLEKRNLEESILKILSKFTKNLQYINFILVDEESYPERILVYTEDKKAKEELLSLKKEIPSLELLSENQIKKIDFSKIVSLYDPKQMFRENKLMKGGVF